MTQNSVLQTTIRHPLHQLLTRRNGAKKWVLVGFICTICRRMDKFVVTQRKPWLKGDCGCFSGRSDASICCPETGWEWASCLPLKTC